MDIYRNWLYYICLPIPIFRRDGEKLHLEFDWEKFKSWQFAVPTSGPSQAWSVVCLPILIFWLDSGKLDLEFDWEKFHVLTVCTPHQWTFTSIYSPVALCKTWFGVWLRGFKFWQFALLTREPSQEWTVCLPMSKNLVWSLIETSFKVWQFALPTSGPSQAWAVCLPVLIFRLDSEKLDLEFDWEKFQVLTVCAPHQWTFTGMGRLFANIYFPTCWCWETWFGVWLRTVLSLDSCTS
jgi:hypothetical protein